MFKEHRHYFHSSTGAMDRDASSLGVQAVESGSEFSTEKFLTDFLMAGFPLHLRSPGLPLGWVWVVMWLTGEKLSGRWA